MVSLEVVPLWTEAFVFQLIDVDAQVRQLGLDLGKLTGLVTRAGDNP